MKGRVGSPGGFTYKFLLLELRVMCPELLRDYYYYTPDAPRSHGYYFRYDSVHRNREDVYIITREKYGRTYRISYYDVPSGQYEYTTRLRYNEVAAYMIRRYRIKKAYEIDFETNRKK